MLDLQTHDQSVWLSTLRSRKS